MFNPLLNLGGTLFTYYVASHWPAQQLQIQRMARRYFTGFIWLLVSLPLWGIGLFFTISSLFFYFAQVADLIHPTLLTGGLSMGAALIMTIIGLNYFLRK